MQRITPDRAWPLYLSASIRRVETQAAQALPPHTLMQRAGLAVARLALALAPHERIAWIVCGPGNNGGDGLEAAMHLRRWGREPVVTWLGREGMLPADAAMSLARARAAGVAFSDDAPAQFGIAIDALLGLGATRALEGRAADHARRMTAAGVPVLAVDLPSGLDADTGQGTALHATHTLSLLALKPGLFTAQGRDACGEVWFDDLQAAQATTLAAPDALLAGPAPTARRPHASHKGSWGDVAVVGGAPGMTGAALLAATAALHAGAGRVYVALLDGGGTAVSDTQPELMFRAPDALDARTLHVACGCGGGDAVSAVLPRLLGTARSLVLDADALNAIAADETLRTLLRQRASRGRPTVLTPHPLEAARLLGADAAQVQSDRLQAAARLVQEFGCTVVLKGSGTVVASPGELPCINPTGNARLATAGTGDVLAGMIAARLAAAEATHAAASHAAYRHGDVADHWPDGPALTAGALARALR